MTDVLQKELDEAYSNLRSIDGDLARLNGRGTLKRQYNANEDSFGMKDRRVRNMEVTSDISGRRDVRRRDSYEDVPLKRTRDDDDFEAPRKSLASQVVMPAIETKSRDAAISEIRDKEVKEVKQRNRRLFGSLLVGTLQRFQKDEKKILNAERAQAEKVAEVEKRLELAKRDELAKAREEKEALLQKRREQEDVLRALNRKKALMSYAAEKTAHYKRLQNFIGTQTTPTIFFLPAKHTLQSLEMLKNSAGRLQTLIDNRQAELEKELAGPIREEDDDTKGLRSHVGRRGDDSGDEDGKDEEIEEGDGERKVVKVESQVEVKVDEDSDDNDGDGEEIEISVQ